MWAESGVSVSSVCILPSNTDTPYHWDTDIKRTEMDTRHWERKTVNKCQRVWQTEQSANSCKKHRRVVQREHSTLHIQRQKPLLEPNNQYKHAWNHSAFSSHIKQDASTLLRSMTLSANKRHFSAGSTVKRITVHLCQGLNKNQVDYAFQSLWLTS